MRARIVVLLGLAASFLVCTFTLRGGLSLGAYTHFGIDDILKVWTVPLLLAMCVPLFMTLIVRTIPSKRTVGIVSVVATLFLAGGYALFLSCTLLSEENMALAVCVSAVCMGAGGGLFSLVWQHHLARFSPEEATRIVLLSLVIGSGAYVLLALALQTNASVSFIALVLIVGTLSLLALTSPALPEDAPRGAPSDTPQKAPSCENEMRTGMLSAVLKELREPLICVCAIAFVATLTRTVALVGRENIGLINILDSVSLIVVSLALYLVWSWFGKRRSIHCTPFSGQVVPSQIGQTTTLRPVAPSSDQSDLEQPDHNLAYNECFDASPGNQRDFLGKLSILGVYLVSFPIIATALLALSLFGSSLSLFVATLVDTIYSLVTAFIMSSCISLARKHALWSPPVYGLFAGVVTLVLAVATPLVSLAYSSSNLGAVAFPVLVLVVLYILAMSYMFIHNRRRKEHLIELQHASSGADTALATSLGRSADNAATTPSATTPSSRASSPRAGVSDESRERCAALIKQKKLTAREGDILMLFAKGRDVPSISKQLYISENTVRTHSKSIYRKLEVNSKQALLDLIESTSLPSAS